jgi:hypothetical protein
MEAIAENTDPAQYAEPRETQRDIKPEQVAILDLKAQSEMAKYTRYIFKATFVQCVIGLLTLAGLGATIYQTGKIVQQDRAWIAFDRRRYKTEDIKESNATEFTCIWRNTGNTPALEVTVGLSVQPIPIADIGDADPIFTHEEMKLFNAGITGPHCKITFGGEITKTNVELLKAKTHRVFVYSRASYKTIYDRKTFKVTETVEEVVLMPSTMIPQVQIIEGKPVRKMVPADPLNIRPVGPQHNAT